MLSFYTQEYPDKPNFIHTKIFLSLSDQFHQDALQSIKAEGSKLRTYAIFKTERGLERYLMDIKNVDIRRQITKFRLSNHQLKIETGRHDQTPAEMRFCPLCEDAVENELHFLFKCPTYNPIRCQFLTNIISLVPQFQTLEDNQKLEHMMKNIDNTVAKFISDVLELRSFLIAKHKMND